MSDRESQAQRFATFAVYGPHPPRWVSPNDGPAGNDGKPLVTWTEIFQRAQDEFRAIEIEALERAKKAVVEAGYARGEPSGWACDAIDRVMPR